MNLMNLMLFWTLAKRLISVGELTLDYLHINLKIIIKKILMLV